MMTMNKTYDEFYYNRNGIVSCCSANINHAQIGEYTMEMTLWETIH